MTRRERRRSVASLYARRLFLRFEEREGEYELLMSDTDLEAGESKNETDRSLLTNPKSNKKNQLESLLSQEGEREEKNEPSSIGLDARGTVDLSSFFSFPSHQPSTHD